MVTSRLFVGIDWGNQHHAVCVVDEQGRVMARFEVTHDLDGIDELTVRLAKAGGIPTIAIERPEGLLVDELVTRGFQVRFINPLQVESLRTARRVAKQKDDRFDALLLAKWLRQEEELFVVVPSLPAEVVALRRMARLHSTLVIDVTRHDLRGRAALAEYYPNFLQVSEDLSHDWVRALFRLAPNPSKAQKVSPTAVARILKAGRVTRWTAQGVVDQLRQPALVASSGLAAGAEDVARYAVEALDVVAPRARAQERALSSAVAEMAGAASPRPADGTATWAEVATAVRSMPGVGGKIGATLIGEAAETLRSGVYQRVRSLAGSAPVTDASGRRSGKSARVFMRRACNRRLRKVLHPWADSAARADPIWKGRLAQLLARGHTPARAKRQLVDRLLRVLCALVRTGTTYDATRLAEVAPTP
jgi:hypothetical protein